MYDTENPEPAFFPGAPPKELKFFAFAHLPEGKLRDTSAKFYRLAADLVETVPDNPERAWALRCLLLAKDAAVRASL